MEKIQALDIIKNIPKSDVKNTLNHIRKYNPDIGHTYYRRGDTKYLLFTGKLTVERERKIIEWEDLKEHLVNQSR